MKFREKLQKNPQQLNWTWDDIKEYVNIYT